MRVLIITPLYPPAIGGAATYFGDIVPDLARRDEIEQLIVLTERMSGQSRRQSEGRLRVLRYLPPRVSRPQRRWLARAVTYVLTQIWFATRLPALVRHHGVDLIHFHTRYRGRLFYAALQRSHVPVIADLRDKMTDPVHLATVADRLLCCGEGVQRFAIEGGFPAERANLIPNSFTLPEVPLAEEVSNVRQRYRLGEGPYLLFAGAIAYNKGIYDLLEAFQHWRHEHPHVRLVFAGANHEEQHFLNRVRQIAGAVYLGCVPHRDMLVLMHGAEIVALPSRSEGLPTVILEAVALGTKVICPPNIPEFERYLPGFVLPEVDVDSIVKTLNTVWRYEDSPSYPLSRHDVRLSVEKLVEAYREVVKV